MRKDSVAGPGRGLAKGDEVRDGMGCPVWGSADIRTPGPKELRLVPAGKARGPMVPRATQGLAPSRPPAGRRHE